MLKRVITHFAEPFVKPAILHFARTVRALMGGALSEYPAACLLNQYSPSRAVRARAARATGLCRLNKPRAHARLTGLTKEGGLGRREDREGGGKREEGGASTKSHASEKIKIPYSGILKIASDVFFDADSESSHMT